MSRIILSLCLCIAAAGGTYLSHRYHDRLAFRVGLVAIGLAVASLLIAILIAIAS